MDTDGYQFKTLEDVINFVEKSKYEKTEILFAQLKPIIKAYGPERGIKYIKYDSVQKLWKEWKDLEFTTFIYKWFNCTAKNIRNIAGKVEDKRINNLITDMDKDVFIKQIVDRLKGMLYDEQFVMNMNSDNSFLPIRGGKKINLRTGEIYERTIEDKFTFECCVDKVAKTPNADRYVFPNKVNREHVRKILGYWITGDIKARSYFICFGNGCNSKSVMMNLVNKILGQYFCTCQPEVFESMSKQAGSASSHLFSLYMKRVGSYSEGKTADDFHLNESCIKQISGDDPITARGLFRDPVTFRSITKLVLLTNFVPDVSADNAGKDRVRYIFFDERFVDGTPINNEKQSDKLFIEKLENEYLDEVFTWIAKGSVEYYKDLKIIPPTEWRERTAKILRQGDSIQTFLTQFVKKTNNNNDKIKKKDLFEMYNNFCHQNSQRCKTRSTFFSRLEHDEYQTTVYHGYDYYRNITCSFKDGECMFDDTDAPKQRVKVNAFLNDNEETPDEPEEVPEYDLDDVDTGQTITFNFDIFQGKQNVRFKKVSTKKSKCKKISTKKSKCKKISTEKSKEVKETSEEDSDQEVEYPDHVKEMMLRFD
jgi:P4 family phage/plasmid primase-like protien